MSKSVLITGSSKGLGIELLRIFLENDWIVYALARNTKSFESISKEFPKTCVPIEGDVTDENITELISNNISLNSNQLDLLINNAGNVKRCFGIDQAKPEDLDEHFKVHVSGAYRIIRATLPYLKKTDSSAILNISSRKASISRINAGVYRILLPYQVAKAAQNMLTVGLRQELRDTNIKVFAIHPGNLKTDAAPPDADIEAKEGAENIFRWVFGKMNQETETFINISDGKAIEW